MTVQQEASRQPVPPHVDPARVIDYDIYGDIRFKRTGDLHEGLYLLGQEVGRGVYWTPHNGGHWLVNSHELIFQAARNPEIFSSNNRQAGDGSVVMIPPMKDGGEPYFAPASLDPPHHLIYRMPLMRAFAPAAIAGLEKGIRELAAELIESIAKRGSCEFLDAVGEPLPVTVFMKMMGMPMDRLLEFRGWMFDMASDDEARRMSAFANIGDMMGDLIAARKAEPRDDLISHLLDADIRGSKPTFKDMQSYCLLLFTAGLDTLVNAFTFGLYQLAKLPELQDRIRADRSLIPNLIEEILRRYGVSMPPRLITRDTEFGGVQLKAGERILLMLPAGNLDPDAYDDPMTFDIDREQTTHLTFNSGPHRCVGSHLARLEMRVFFEEWFERMPTVHPDPQAKPTYRPAMNLTICKLPLVWDVK